MNRLSAFFKGRDTHLTEPRRSSGTPVVGRKT